ncbi:alpha/beta fold hydrolase [Solicola gregarius]|uniref:Alpha/beta hydrolase n=1 Tax=Solicola gregarius TaxID=2908642 RepID=A0AA46TJI3_9ACTN|nr:alpha/beta fold hydrolase [Solicola gregarius]UYM06487.1 alpha/beta hydrolase [Solicola gregarius]
MATARASDGAAIHYDVRGDGERSLLLLAGQSNDHRWWDSVRADFDARFRTIAVDWRGTGASDKPADDSYSTTRFADDALAVLDDLGIARTHLYGTSMGGRVAQWLAAGHPDRVDRLVLGCTSPGGRHGFERNGAVIRSLTQPDRDAARRALLELMYTPGWLATHPGPHYTVGDPGMTPHARSGHLKASRRHDSWDLLPDIAAPTLVVHGTDDKLSPAANATLIAGRIADARAELIDGARHAYFEEFRAVASPLVVEFLEGRGPARSAYS